MTCPTMRIDLFDGKYTVVCSPQEFKALRYGEEWRDLTGDKLVFAMFDRIVELEIVLKERQ